MIFDMHKLICTYAQLVSFFLFLLVLMENPTQTGLKHLCSYDISAVASGLSLKQTQYDIFFMLCYTTLLICAYEFGIMSISL